MTVEYLDTVKSKISGVVGVVTAIYTDPINNLEYIDIKLDNRIWYNSLASNWEVVAKNDELEEL